MRALDAQTRGITPEEQAAAQEAFNELSAGLIADGGTRAPSQNKLERGYVDGCYDLCHSGHFNAIRQAS